MKLYVVLSLVFVLTVAAVSADDKPIRKAKFVTQTTSFGRGLCRSGTDARWEAFCMNFRDQFTTAQIEFDAMVSKVKREDGTAFISFHSGVISKLCDASPLSAFFTLRYSDVIRIPRWSSMQDRKPKYVTTPGDRVIEPGAPIEEGQAKTKIICGVRMNQRDFIGQLVNEQECFFCDVCHALVLQPHNQGRRQTTCSNQCRLKFSRQHSAVTPSRKELISEEPSGKFEINSKTKGNTDFV